MAAGVAAAGVVALGGVIVTRDPGSRTDDEVPAVNDSPAAIDGEMEEWPDEFDSLLASALPDGFSPIHSLGAPLSVVAYNDDGVRLEVLIEIDAATDRTTDTTAEVAESPDGDRVTGSVISDYDVLSLNSASAASVSDPPQSFVDARAVLPNVLNDVARQFTGEIRSDILTATYPVIDSAELRAAVDSIGVERFGSQLSNRALGAADFAFTYRHDDVAYTFAVIRTPTGLPDGVTQPSVSTTTGRTWTNGWQVVITLTATVGAPERLIHV